MQLRLGLFCLLSMCCLLDSVALPPFESSPVPPEPDYASEQYWSALPFREDAGDLWPKAEQLVPDSLKTADVFYIYPTLFTKGKTWNADVNDKRLNKRIDRLPVRYQAGIFNASCRVYAPRYRQAIVQSFTDTTGEGEKALDLAYTDVKKAFAYYLTHYNQGRPIVIASHSQGTAHARRLLQDFFDTPDMRNKLVCAYIVGLEVNREMYRVLQPCGNPDETNCYVTWASFKHGYDYTGKLPYFGNVCVNPISWQSDAALRGNSSGILLNVNRKKKFSATAQINKHYLWVKSNMTFMKRRNILHLVDFNLFWWDVRKNVAQRVNAYQHK